MQKVENEIKNSEQAGVGPKGTLIALDPRQERFISLYFDAVSTTFGNCYQSALSAGYTNETARNLTHNKPKWLSEKIGKMQTLDPELILVKLTSIINSPTESTQNKLRAIDMMMKHYRMFNDSISLNATLNIQSVLD